MISFKVYHSSEKERKKYIVTRIHAASAADSFLSSSPWYRLPSDSILIAELPYFHQQRFRRSCYSLGIHNLHMKAYVTPQLRVALSKFQS